MTARLVIDASVAMKWILAEPDSSLAEPLADEDLCAPELLLVECANAAWKEVEREGGNPEVTADARFVRLVRKHPKHAAHVVLLSEFAH